MQEEKSYSKWTLEELLVKEKALKKKETIASFIIGFLVAPMIYGVATKGFGFIYVIIPLALIYGIYRDSQKRKQVLRQIRIEISARKMAQ
ncbi:MAG: hypothetical protein AAF849_06775 [Bacteroidota bacterium]